MATRRQIAVGLGILVNSNCQILISLRNDPAHPQAHMKWELPGGAIEFGETIEQTVVREMHEELGIVVELLPYPPLLGSSVWDHGNAHVHVLLTGLICKTAQPIVHNNQEVVETKWIDPETIDTYDHLPVCDVFVKKTAEYIARGNY